MADGLSYELAVCDMMRCSVSLVQVWLGQDPSISALSARFVQLLTPTLLLNAVGSCLHNHLTCQVRAACALLSMGCCTCHLVSAAPGLC